MAKKYWFFITNEDNWEIISKKMTYGFMERTKKDLQNLSIGDLVLIYIKGKKIGGAFSVSSLNPSDKVIFIEKDYPYQVALKKIFIPKNPMRLHKNIVNKISIFKNHSRWGVLLMGRSTKEISKEDYKMVKELM